MAKLNPKTYKKVANENPEDASPPEESKDFSVVEIKSFEFQELDRKDKVAGSQI